MGNPVFFTDPDGMMASANDPQMAFNGMAQVTGGSMAGGDYEAAGAPTSYDDLQTQILDGESARNGDNDSTHTDANGNVVAVYDDGDLGVYKHNGNAAQAKKEVDANYSSTNTSAGGQKMGETWTSLGFADFNAYSNGIVKPAEGAMIDFNSNWATEMVSAILNSNPTLGEYASKARGNHEWDIKKSSPNGKTSFGSSLFGKFASARDAGNYAAGAVAQSSIFPNLISDYGFGTYNASGNSVGGAFKMMTTDLLNCASPITSQKAQGAFSISNKALFGKHPLSRAGIEAGKSYITIENNEI